MPIPAAALDLGDVEVHSFLNQPLHAEIAVIATVAGDTDALSVGLASRDDFARAGLSRPDQLSELRFTLQKNSTGRRPVIRVTSKAAIKTPLLHFLLEVDWVRGRLLREFTILLDAPLREASASITIKQGDTLWRITSSLYDGSYSMDQIMLAIQRLNPAAFGDGNINHLKTGSVLRIPDADEIGRLNQQSAHTQVLEQNQRWIDRSAGVASQVAPDKAVAETTVTDNISEPQAELSLLAPGDDEAEHETEDALSMQLALAEEERDAAREQSQELIARIAVLEARLDKLEALQKMLEIENASLAKIQSDQTMDDNPSEGMLARLMNIFKMMLANNHFVVDPVLLVSLAGILLVLTGLLIYRPKKPDDIAATQDTDAFIREAETLKSMSHAADRYWDRAQNMGGESTPHHRSLADDSDDLILPDDVDEISSKLDLARAFIDMGDIESARRELDEVMQDGNHEQKAEARALINQL